MRVGELVRRKGASVVTVEHDARLDQVVRLLMQHGVGGLPVVDGGGRVLGFVSERDIVDALDRANGDVRDMPVANVMRRPPTCAADVPVPQVMARMTRERLRHLVVIEEDRVAGIISVGDIVKHRLEELETETGVLRDYVAARRATV